MDNINSLKITLTSNLSKPIELYFDNLPKYAFTSTEIKYINKDNEFEGIPCYISITTYEYIFVIQSKNPKALKLTKSFLKDDSEDYHYIIDEEQMWPIYDFSIDEYHHVY